MSYEFHRPKAGDQTSPFVPMTRGSVFATEEELRKARRSEATSQNAIAKRQDKPHVAHVEPKRKSPSGPKWVEIDCDLLFSMIDSGTSHGKCAAFFHVSRDVIRLRLGLKLRQRVLRDNTGSSFNTPIATQKQSDRTNSIAGRV